MYLPPPKRPPPVVLAPVAEDALLFPNNPPDGAAFPVPVGGVEKKELILPVFQKSNRGVVVVGSRNGQGALTPI